jgi:hypothetical protein
MINLSYDICSFENCKTCASFNYSDLKKGIYCGEHKLKGMINIKTSKCSFENCIKRPFFNYSDKLEGLYCNKHKLDGMVSLRNNKCIFENCTKIAQYNNNDFKKRLFCSDHKNENMVRLSNNICNYENCKITASFNYEGSKKGLYCFNHKLENMINVTHKKCLTEKCYIRSTNILYEGYCLFCFIHIFPDKKIARNYKTKEKHISDFIKENFKDLEWKFDKIIADGCSNKRPDILLDLGYKIIIIEIDEYQHKNYIEICENKRIMEISKDLDFRPITIIRFNPDDYCLDEQKIPSCWKVNKLGILTINKTFKKDWELRLNKLKETILFWIENNSEKNINIVKLFYDI